MHPTLSSLAVLLALVNVGKAENLQEVLTEKSGIPGGDPRDECTTSDCTHSFSVLQTAQIKKRASLMEEAELTPAVEKGYAQKQGRIDQDGSTMQQIRDQERKNLPDDAPDALEEEKKNEENDKKANMLEEEPGNSQDETGLEEEKKHEENDKKANMLEEAKADWGVSYSRKHGGACHSGWIRSLRTGSEYQCFQKCNVRWSGCGYFAFSWSRKNNGGNSCALYRYSGGCRSGAGYRDFTSYKLTGPGFR
jgi:hypothetical protein